MWRGRVSHFLPAQLFLDWRMSRGDSGAQALDFALEQGGANCQVWVMLWIVWPSSLSFFSLTHWGGSGVVGLCQTPVSGTSGVIAWDLMVPGPWDLVTKKPHLYACVGPYCWQNMFTPSLQPPSEGRARRVLSKCLSPLLPRLGVLWGPPFLQKVSELRRMLL